MPADLVNNNKKTAKSTSVTQVVKCSSSRDTDANGHDVLSLQMRRGTFHAWNNHATWDPRPFKHLALLIQFFLYPLPFTPRPPNPLVALSTTLFPVQFCANLFHYISS